MTTEEILKNIELNNLTKIHQFFSKIDNPTKEKEIIQNTLKVAEEYLLKNKWTDNDKKHQYIQNIAYLCSLSPYHESTSKEYYDKYVHMLIDMEIPQLQIAEDSFFSFKTINMYSIEDFINNTITVSSPKTFNDPLDPPITLAAKHKFENIEKQKDEYFFLNSLEKVRIKCFMPAKHPNNKKELKPYLNTLMWAHYANSHKGICIKYKLSSTLIKRDNKITGLFASVEYPEVPFNIESENHFEFNECFLIKQAEWKYENEVRLIYFNADNSDNFQTLKLEGDNKIEAIYFGYRCSQTEKDTIKNILKNNSEIRFFQMKIDYKNIFQLKADEET